MPHINTPLIRDHLSHDPKGGLSKGYYCTCIVCFMGNEVWLHAIEAHIVKGRILLKELEVHFQGRRDESDKNIEFSTRGAIFVGQRHKP